MNWALSLIFGGHSFGKSRKAAEKSSTVRWEKINKQQWRNNDLKVQEELRNSREECCHADDIICKKLGSAMHLIKKLFFWYLKLWVYRGRDQLMKSSTPFYLYPNSPSPSLNDNSLCTHSGAAAFIVLNKETPDSV